MTTPGSATRRAFLAEAGGALALAALSSAEAADPPPPGAADAVRPPDWVYGVTRMTFVTPGQVAAAAQAGFQVVHTNLVWPYFPLRRDNGGLSADDDRRLRDLVADCHRLGLKVVLGLPPFPPVALVREHPDWRVHADDGGAILKAVPSEKDLGTRRGCNLGPWGDYLIEVCAELTRDYHLDGFSFDGNYHPPLCHCPACKAAYRKDTGRPLPTRVSLDDLAYREYLVWRGERLEDHYRRLQRRLKAVHPDAVLMSWTVNAGRYGHLVQSPRSMPTRLNQLFDLPMQEWWLDETNLGASLLPSFGAAYLRATAGDRPCAAEPYLMSRGTPPGTDSFPAHERLTRCLLNLTYGGVAAESLGWPGHEASARADARAVAERAPYLTRAAPLPWAGLLVSEQTRQFHAYQDIPERFIPHVLGAFRAATEEHLPLTLLNDWDLDTAGLGRYAVVVLPSAAALSDAQAAAVRDYVRRGGGLVATGETSLADDLGRPRRDFALADVFGISYRGRPVSPAPADAAVRFDEDYWKHRTGVALLSWGEHPLVQDRRLRQLVPGTSVHFRGPLVRVSEPEREAEVAVRLLPDGGRDRPLPAAVLRRFGEGRVAYFAAGVDAALWSYSYPYQRRLLAGALEWAARVPAPVSVTAPMGVQATCFLQSDRAGRRTIIHLFNGLNTTANHGLPAADVPLREEAVPVHGIEVRFHRDVPKAFRCEPGGRPVRVRREGETAVVELPPLDIHALLVGEG
jgi:hypothetical protein